MVFYVTVAPVGEEFERGDIKCFCVDAAPAAYLKSRATYAVAGVHTAAYAREPHQEVSRFAADLVGDGEGEGSPESVLATPVNASQVPFGAPLISIHYFHHG